MVAVADTASDAKAMPANLQISSLGEDASRRVEFAEAVKIILVPSRGEYKSSGICNMLWWDAFEFSQFQATASVEIRAFAQDQGIGARAARRKLYQPLPRDILHRERAPSYAEAKRHSHQHQHPHQHLGSKRALHLQMQSEPKTRSGRVADGSQAVQEKRSGRERERERAPVSGQQQQQQHHTRVSQLPAPGPRPGLGDGDDAVGLALSPTSPTFPSAAPAPAPASISANLQVPVAQVKLKSILRVRSLQQADDEDEEEGMYTIDEGSADTEEAGAIQTLKMVARNIHTGTMSHLTNGSDRRLRSSGSCGSIGSRSSSDRAYASSTDTDGAGAREADFEQVVNLEEGEVENAAASALTLPDLADLESPGTEEETQESPPGRHRRLLSHVDSMSLLHVSGAESGDLPSEPSGEQSASVSLRRSAGSSSSSNGNGSGSGGTSKEKTAFGACDMGCDPSSTPNSPSGDGGSHSVTATSAVSSEELQRLEASLEEDADLYAIPPMQRTNSLDCVKTAQRCPVKRDGEYDSSLQDMSDSVKFWDLHRRNKGDRGAGAGAGGTSSASADVEAVVPEIDNLTLCVPMAEPGKLRSDALRRGGTGGRFSPRQASADDWAMLRLVAWVVIAVVVLVMVLDCRHEDIVAKTATDMAADAADGVDLYNEL